MAQKLKRFKNAREAWDTLWAPGQEAIRKEFTKHFRGLFPDGHRESLRAVVGSMRDEDTRNEFCAHKRGKWLKGTHTDAYEFLELHGIDYRPFAFRSYPDFGIGEPVSRECYRNAFILMCEMNLRLIVEHPVALTYMRERGPMVYVEGITAGAISEPMQHAWNALGNSRVAIDWTHCASARWDRYIGFPVTLEEHTEAMRILNPKKEVRLPLFDQYTFGSIKNYLYSLAESRTVSAPPGVA
jgi:hypothetical protein